MFLRVALILLFSFVSLSGVYCEEETAQIKLSPPFKNDPNGLKVLLDKRYSCRSFLDKKIDLDDLATLLWASSGKKTNTQSASRTIPSAGAIYPLEIYLLVSKNSVPGLKEGIYHYIAEEHTLKFVKERQWRQDLKTACLNQNSIAEAPIILVIAAQFTRTSRRYHDRAERYVYMEAGHACQNIYLATADLNLATVEIGAFSDDKLKDIIGLPEDYAPIAVMPIGHAK